MFADAATEICSRFDAPGGFFNDLHAEHTLEAGRAAQLPHYL